MREENQQNPAPDADATLVRPLFTEEAAETARPVEPLTESAAAVAARHEESAAPVRYVSRPRTLRHWPVALVLVSALAGALVGGLALRFYQARRDAEPRPAAAEQATAPEAERTEVAQPAPPVTNEPAPAEQQPQPPAEAPADAPQTQEQPAPRADAAPAETRPATRDDGDAGRPDSARREATENARPVAASDEREDDGRRKRGKRGENEDEAREVVRSRRAAQVPPTPSPEGARVGQREPRLVDVLQGEPERRQRRRSRERVARPRDSVRAIFEGQPPR